MNENILEIKGLVKRYDRFSLKALDLMVPRGYIMGLMGRNGAGKSTTVKCIMNLIDYEGGSIKAFGMDTRQHVMEVRNRIGYVSEEQYFYEEETVKWTAKFIGSFYSQWDQKHLETLLRRFDIDPGKRIRELSKGMKMKLALALAMAHRPELLLLDEPTSGLDPVVRSELLEMFLEIIQDERCSILFSSHISSDIEKVADYVTVIDGGRVVISEEKDTIMNEWKIIKAENSYYDKRLCDRLIGVRKGEFGFSGLTNRLDAFASEFRRAYPNGSFKTERINLDELLVRMVKEGEQSA